MNMTVYLNSQIRHAFINEGQLVFISGVIQLAFVVSSSCRSHINGHTVGLHITQHSAAPFIRYLLTSDHVTLHYLVWYRFLEHDDAIFVTCERHEGN